ncbi:MAG: hypothetical protein ACOYX1_02520 [Acidobacteriota bacterium]
MIGDDFSIAQTVSEIAAQLKPTAPTDLIEERGAIRFNQFQAWQRSSILWERILPSRNDWVWFDVVIYDPIADHFRYAAVYNGNDFDGFKQVQGLADWDSYISQVTSLSKLLVEGLVPPERRCAVHVRQEFQPQWSFNVVDDNRLLKVRVIHPENVAIGSQNDWDIIAQDACRAETFGSLLGALSGLAGQELDKESVARYFVWLSALPDWKSYLYYPVPGLASKTGALVFAFPTELKDAEAVRFCKELEPRLAVLSLVLGWAATELVHGHARRAAEVAIMARNMSHNLGSHALRSVDSAVVLMDARTEIDGVSGGQVPTLLGYVQQRMDFVARVAVDWPTSRQPMFFFRDVVQLFTRQGLLLEFLLADEGYQGRDKIRFQYGVARGGDGGEIGWDWTDRVPNDDLLVAIPGGSLGRQAFYGFLENAMRNAARHNQPPDPEGITIYLAIRDCEDHYELLYADSISKADHSTIENLEKILQKPLLEADGRVTGEYWGMHEMRVCARFLGYAGTLESYCQERLRVQAVSLPSGKNVIGYWLHLQKPTLACLLDFGAADQSQVFEGPALKRFGVQYVRPTGDERPSLASEQGDDKLVARIRRLSPELLCVRTGENNGKAVLRWLENNAHRLPARIMLTDCNDSTSHISMPPGVWQLADTSNEGVQKWLLYLYKAWVLGLAERRRLNSLNLWVDTAEEPWRTLKREAEQGELLSQDSGLQLDPGTDPPRQDGPLLLWRHRFDPCYSGQAVFQQAWGGPNRAAKAAIEHICTGFGGLFFLMRLFEACLLRVLVIDERIAKQVTSGRGRELFLAQVFAVVAIEYDGRRIWIRAEWERSPIEDQHLSELAPCNSRWKLWLWRPGSAQGSLPDSFDVVVIHRTQLERIHGNPQEFVDWLSAGIAWRTVVTSGRGSLLARDPFTKLPFVDFSALDGSLVRETWKLEATAALMSAL